MRGSGLWKPKARWLIRRILELRPSRRPFESPDRGEDPVAVLAQGAREPDERLEPGARCPGQPCVEVRRRQRWIIEVVEQPELFAQEEGAVEAAVLVLDFGERGELSDRL